MWRRIVKAGLLASLCVFSACTSKTEYTNALPKDASMVVAMELDEMVVKAGLNTSSGDKAIGKLKSLIKGGLQGEAAQLAERMVEHPSESGLSWEDKVYLFATPHAGALAMLAKVEDEGKLEKLMEVLAKESIANPLREESECRWTQVGSAICAFNRGTFLLMQPSKGDAMSMKGMLLSLMRQQEGEGFASLPEFAKLEAEGNDIASVVNLAAIPYEMTTRLRMGISADIRLEDIKYLLTANFEQGRLLVKAESLIQNPRILSFFEALEQVMTPVQGRMMELYPGNTFCWASVNVKGKELYNMLRQNPAIRQKLDNPPLPVDVEWIFSSIDGEVSVGGNPMGGNAFLLYADVNNRDFLKTFEDLRPMLALTGGQIALDQVGHDEYLMRTYEGYYWFGVKNGKLYATNVPSMAKEAGRTFGASMGVKPWSAQVKENRFFATVNLNGMKQMFLDLADYANVAMPDCSHAEVELQLKDKNENLLKLLVETLVKM